MASPKERLRDAAQRLAGRAEFIEDIAEESHNGTVKGGQGEISKVLLIDTLGEVKGIVSEIEAIIR